MHGRYGYITGTLFIGILSWYAYTYSTGVIYDEYQKLWEYRRLHPDFQPNPSMIRAMSAGHTTTYADTLWINLIQYIGDNVGTGKFRFFLNPLIDTMSDLHPSFTAPYNLALLLSPNINPENPTTETNRPLAEMALKIGERGLENTCDTEKIDNIKKLSWPIKIEQHPTLANPCLDGMIPYNLAYIADELGDHGKSETYYKIAAIHQDAPSIAGILGPLVIGKGGDNKEAAKKILLVAIGGYDEEPYTCRKTALKILESLRDKPIGEYIYTLRTLEEGLPAIQDTKNPLSYSPTNCRESTIRGIKQIYYAYIQDITKPYPELKRGEDIIDAKLMKYIPTIVNQDGWGIVRKNDGKWIYRERKYLSP